MAAIVTVEQLGIDQTLNRFVIKFTIALSANYGGAATHGDTLNFGAALGPNIPSNSVPDFVSIVEMPPAGTAPTGYLFGFAPGTTQDNGVLTIWNNLTEYTEGSAYSAGLLAAVLVGRAEFPAFI